MVPQPKEVNQSVPPRLICAACTWVMTIWEDWRVVLAVLQRLGKILWQVSLEVCSTVRKKNSGMQLVKLVAMRRIIARYTGRVVSKDYCQAHWLHNTIPEDVAVNLIRKKKKKKLPRSRGVHTNWRCNRIQFCCIYSTTSLSDCICNLNLNIWFPD